jgi:NhaP-type Na+/H+ or K+/H+ antiporter
MIAVFAFVLLVYLYSLVSRRLEGTIFGIPIVFTSVGVVLAFAVPSLVRREVNNNVWLTLAEITYVIVLFNGAMRVNFAVLRRKLQLPGRLLLIGLPLTIVFGILASRVILPDLTLWEAGVLACILASTDTGLAELIVTSRRVPSIIREALSAESGLNDGMVVPILMVFISLIRADTSGLAILFLRITGQQIGYSIPIGAAIGILGGWLLGIARRRGWATASFQQIAMIALACLCLILAGPVRTSPFIAAFTAGIAFKFSFRESAEGIVEFSENEGRLLNMVTFFLFGMVAGSSLGEIILAPFLYAILSLTLVRMLSVSISMINTHLSAASVLFMGWFGPRGLASIVLALVIVGQNLQTTGTPLAKQALIATILLSIFAHGLSASLGIDILSRRIARLGSDAPEYEAVPELQTQ